MLDLQKYQLKKWQKFPVKSNRKRGHPTVDLWREGLIYEEIRKHNPARIDEIKIRVEKGTRRKIRKLHPRSLP